MLIAICARDEKLVWIGGRIALAQSGLPSLSIAANNSPGVGIVSRSDFTAPANSSLVKAGPVGSGAASSAERTYAGQAIAPAMHAATVSLRRVLIMVGSLEMGAAGCRWNIEAE